MSRPQPTFLIVGATGNTGVSLVRTLSSLLPASPFPKHTILAQTRSASSPVAQSLGTLPSVQVVEKNWIDIDAAWLKAHNVVRAFIASHNGPSQFTDESTFHLACLEAGVEYVVRISTTAANVTPTCKAYYPRSHWAVEELLSSQEFKKGGLKWSSLQPNVFHSFYLGTAVQWIKDVKAGREAGVLKLMADRDAKVGIVHADDVGTFGAHLLITPEGELVARKKRYTLNGPEDVTGAQVVQLVEKYSGTKVSEESVSYRNLEFLDGMVEQAPAEAKVAIRSIKYAPVTAWEGNCGVDTTSREVLELAPPKSGVEDVLKELLEKKD